MEQVKDQGGSQSLDKLKSIVIKVRGIILCIETKPSLFLDCPDTREERDEGVGRRLLDWLGGVERQGWKFMSCGHCQELGQQAS